MRTPTASFKRAKSLSRAAAVDGNFQCASGDQYLWMLHLISPSDFDILANRDRPMAWTSAEREKGAGMNPS